MKRAIGMMLEKAVGDRAQAIVGAGARLAHRVLRAWIVEAGQEDERAIADVAVGVLGHGLQQRRHRLRRDGPADRASRAGAGGVIEVAELVDGGLQLVGGDGLRSARFLGRQRRARHGGHQGHRGHSTDSEPPRPRRERHASCDRRRAPAPCRRSAPCRASARAAGSVASSRGNGTG